MDDLTARTQDFPRPHPVPVAREEGVYRALIQTSRDGFISYACSGRILDVNEALCRMLGYTQEELLSMSIADIEVAQGAEASAARIQKIIRVGSELFQTRQRRKDGAVIDVEVNAQYVSELGERLFAFIRDISERKQAEAALRESERRFRQLANSLPQLVWTCQPEGPCDFLSQQWLSYTGIPEAPQLGFGWLEQLHPDDRAPTVAAWQAAAASGTDFHVEFRIRRHDGEYHWFDTQAVRLSDEEGRTVKWFGSNTDISERKQAEATLARRLRIAHIFSSVHDDEMYNEVLNIVLDTLHSPFGVFGFIDEADALVVPTMTRQIWDKCQIADKAFIFPRASWGDSSWPRAIREKKANYSNELSTKMPGGHLAVQRHVSLPILFQGEVIGLFQVANRETDYTDADVRVLEAIAEQVAPLLSARLRLERAQASLSRLNAELEQRVAQRTAQLQTANADMEGFSYSVSHDLRAPLRAIDGFASMLREDYAARLDAEGQRLLQVVSDNAKKMGQLIDDILAFSRAGRLELQQSRLDMNALVQQVWHDLEPQRGGRAIELKLADLPAASGDPAAMRQVLQNLLANALKFTRPRATVLIEVAGRSEAEENVYSIRDNGVGFDMAYYNKLYGLFQRLHGMEEFEGTGVGLAIVKRFITKHGGRVWAEGKVGEGATFWFTLPAQG